MKRPPRMLLLLATVFTLAPVHGSDRLDFPTAKRVPVVNTYHGVAVRDDFQWMENENDPRVRRFAEAQTKRTSRYLDRLPPRAAIEKQLATWQARSAPSHLQLVESPAGLFALISAPGKQQRFVALMTSVDDPGTYTVVLDPNVIDPSGATAIDWWVPSPSGKFIAASLSPNGSELGTLHFFNSATGTPLPDRIPRVQIPTGGGSVAWSADESTVFYTRFPAPDERPAAELWFYQQVYSHRLGTDPAEDTYVIGREFPRIAEIDLTTSPDGAYTLAAVANGDGGDFAYHLRAPDGQWREVARFTDGVKAAMVADDGMLYVLTRQDAPRGRILRMPLNHADLGSAVEVVSQSARVIRGFTVRNRRLYVHEIDGGPSRLQLYSSDGASNRNLDLPDTCAINALVTRADGTLLLRVSRYVEPPAWYVYNPTTGSRRKTALADAAPATFDDVRVERLFATAPDGTAVPLTVLTPKSVAPGTAAPLLLKAYGSYGAVNAPAFQTNLRLWFNAGGVVAIAHVRGGGELGEAWHQAGRLERKATTFSDFIVCARHLITQGRTRSEQLAIEGGSAGGLLMGAVLTQEPALFRAVVAHVGIFDALRVELAPNGEFNTTEFGTVKVRAQFEAMHAYSPYHHVADGNAYPAVLLTTGMFDGRVPPAQSFKMAARLQRATTSRHPVLLRVNLGAGHGIGTSRSTRLAQDVDTFSFLFTELGMSVAP